MVASEGTKQPGAPRPRPGAHCTVRSSRSVRSVTASVNAADKASHAPRGAVTGAGAVTAGGGVLPGPAPDGAVSTDAGMTCVAMGSSVRGRVANAGDARMRLDLLTEGERGDRAPVDGADNLGDHVTVFFGRDTEKVGHCRLEAQDTGYLLEGDQLA